MKRDPIAVSQNRLNEQLHFLGLDPFEGQPRRLDHGRHTFVLQVIRSGQIIKLKKEQQPFLQYFKVFIVHLFKSLENRISLIVDFIYALRKRLRIDSMLLLQRLVQDLIEIVGMYVAVKEVLPYDGHVDLMDSSLFSF